MPVNYEEKTFESYFNTELSRVSSAYFPFGQVQEGGIGADSSAYSRNRRLWLRLGFPFYFFPLHKGVSLQEIATEMEQLLSGEISGIPTLKVNLLFQYKRPKLITSHKAAEWSSWNQKYFRYLIYQEQQKLLEHLSSAYGGKILVLYAAPAIEDVEDLVRAHNKGNIIKSTNFRPAKDLANHHKNTYIKAGAHSIAFSEPQEMPRFDLLEEIGRLKESNNYIRPESVASFAKAVRDVTLESKIFGNAMKEYLSAYEEVQYKEYPLLYAHISMQGIREITGIQWVMM